MDAKQFAAARGARRHVDLPPRDAKRLRHQANQLRVRFALVSWSRQPYAQAAVGDADDFAARRPRRDPDGQAHAVGGRTQRSFFTT